MAKGTNGHEKAFNHRGAQGRTEVEPFLSLKDKLRGTSIPVGTTRKRTTEFKEVILVMYLTRKPLCAPCAPPVRPCGQSCSRSKQLAQNASRSEPRLLANGACYSTRLHRAGLQRTRQAVYRERVVSTAFADRPDPLVLFVGNEAAANFSAKADYYGRPCRRRRRTQCSEVA